MCTSKKAIASQQLSLELEITLKSTLLLSRRIREAMHNDDFAPTDGMGEVVEVD